MHIQPELLEQITAVIEEVIRDDAKALEQLTVFGGSSAFPPALAQLCEQVALLAIQNEAGKMRLENIIEELLATKTNLQEARNDPLTGLPNRTKFHQRLEQLRRHW